MILETKTTKTKTHSDGQWNGTNIYANIPDHVKSIWIIRLMENNFDAWNRFERNDPQFHDV